MDNKSIPYKGLNTKKNNGLSDAQEVNYSDDFKKAYKEESQKENNKSKKNE